LTAFAFIFIFHFAEIIL